MTEHVGDLLSAHLDGELTEEEATAVEAHLARCETCRAELDAISEVRRVVRAAPLIDPPFGFYERLVRRRRTRWAIAASTVAVAAAWFVVAGFAVAPERAKVVPPVEAARASLANTNRVEVSVLRANVDWSKLEGGLRHPVTGLPGTPWESIDADGTKALVYETDGSTVMVVGDVPVDQLEEAARDVRSDLSLLDHLRDAAATLIDAFSLR